METIYLSLRSQLAVGTFLMISPVAKIWVSPFHLLKCKFWFYLHESKYFVECSKKEEYGNKFFLNIATLSLKTL